MEFSSHLVEENLHHRSVCGLGPARDGLDAGE